MNHYYVHCGWRGKSFANGKNNIHYHLDCVLDFCRMEKREMNHDYAHCLDYTKDCPKGCFRAELQRDIEENRSEFIGVPLTYTHLSGTEECELAREKRMNDTISRQAAIKAIDDLPNCYNGYSDTYDKAYIIGVLEELPSAVKHGRWIDATKEIGWPEVKCSVCGSIGRGDYLVCPWCGARMDKGGDAK